MSSPLIVTLKLDHATFEQMNTLRQRHFPPERNFLPAHVTLFHALPHHQQSLILRDLQQVCAQTSNIPLQLPTLRSLGRGVAVEIQSSELVQLRQTLATTWYQWLTPQDRQGYRPHITIQNKVDLDVARQLYEQLLQEWQPLSGYGEGLLLWYYRGGPWELAQDIAFQS